MFFFFQAEDGIRDIGVTGVQTCALPISLVRLASARLAPAAVVGVGVAAMGAGLGMMGLAGIAGSVTGGPRSGERRVGEECRSRWSAYHLKKKQHNNLASYKFYTRRL